MHLSTSFLTFLALLPPALSQVTTVVVSGAETSTFTLPAWTASSSSKPAPTVLTSTITVLAVTTTTRYAGSSAISISSNSSGPSNTSTPIFSTPSELSPQASSYASHLLSAETTTASTNLSITPTQTTPSSTLLPSLHLSITTISIPLQTAPRPILSTQYTALWSGNITTTVLVPSSGSGAATGTVSATTALYTGGAASDTVGKVLRKTLVGGLAAIAAIGML